MKNILLGILAISITFISFNLAQPKNLPAPPLVPTVSDISTNLRPPRIIMMPQRDKGGYSDYDHMKCLEQALLKPRGEKRNNARKNCNQSSH